MSEKCRSVKIACITALIASVVFVIAGIVLVVQDYHDVANWLLLAASVVLLVISFQGARLINVPSNASKVRGLGLVSFIASLVADGYQVVFVTLGDPIGSLAITLILTSLVLLFSLVILCLSHSLVRALSRK